MQNQKIQICPVCNRATEIVWVNSHGNVVFVKTISTRAVVGKRLMMKIKTTLKKLKRGDVVSIDWIDAGDLDDSPSSWFSQEEAEKVFKEIPVQTIAVYFGHGKENFFLVRDTEKQDIKDPYYNGACVIPIGCIRSVEKLSN